MSLASQGPALAMSITPHPFDPLTPQEIRLGLRILQSAFPGVQLRINRIDLQEPLKNDVIPYIEAERLGKPLPPKPARLLYAYFHRLDTGACCKALLNADNASVIYAKELPAGVQVT
jgi:primary-amine oxidase